MPPCSVPTAVEILYLIREAQQFRCASCGSTQKVVPGKETVEEYDFSEYRAREGRRMLKNGETALRCSACGAEFFLPAEGTAAVCPMCGSPQIETGD